MIISRINEAVCCLIPNKEMVVRVNIFSTANVLRLVLELLSSSNRRLHDSHGVISIISSVTSSQVLLHKHIGEEIVWQHYTSRLYQSEINELLRKQIINQICKQF